MILSKQKQNTTKMWNIQTRVLINYTTTVDYDYNYLPELFKKKTNLNLLHI